MARVEVFVLFSTKKKGNALRPQDVFLARGHLNAEDGKEEMTTRKGTICLCGASRSFILVLF